MTYASPLLKRLRTMADSRRRSLSRLLAALTVAVTALLAPSQVAADIILDEFTDSAMVEIPRMEDVFVETPNVGDLNARREIAIVSSGNPIGKFDINVTSPGQMTVEIDEIVPSPTSNLPLTPVHFNYMFDHPTDVTEGGRNDAIMFDFVELVGDIQPTFLRAWVFHDTNPRDSFIIELRPLVENRSPHTLVAPFAEFTVRGGAPGTPDPTALNMIYFDFFFLGHTGELNWGAQLERVRFGPTAVPEPESLLLALAIPLFWSSCRLLGGRQGLAAPL